MFLTLIPSSLFLLLAILTSNGFGDNLYNMIEGFQCVRSDFVETPLGAETAIDCAHHCSSNRRCQAFSLADGPCRLFVFDKCSKSVRDCGCSRRGPVFVKKQPGLEAGALCPTGYGDDLCGVKYKFYADNETWSLSRSRCESDAPLVIMADIADSSEKDHINDIYKIHGDFTFWLGGLQAPGSPEPAGGWYWVGCNISIPMGSLWQPGQPADDRPNENVVAWQRNYPGLSDFRDNSSLPNAVLCECVSPF